MDFRLSRLIFDHWQRKAVGIVLAIIIWLFVNHSITETKVVPNIPVKIVNIPHDKTIVGLLPNGTLSRRITLTLSGTKDVVNEIESGDIEVVLDASGLDSDEWVVDITKKNLLSLNPSINLASNITNVEYPDFVIHLSKLVTAKIPINILPPTGEAPSGYDFLDIWPHKLFQTVTASEEEIGEITARGLQWQTDLSDIKKADLDHLKSTQNQNSENNEISYLVPQRLKKITFPIRDGQEEEINDPEAKSLQVNFLQRQWLPIKDGIPIRVFYPVDLLESINPISRPLATNEKIISDHAITLYKPTVYLYGVSKHFLDVVKNNLEIAIIANEATPEKNNLDWGLNVVNAKSLENDYVEIQIAHDPSRGSQASQTLRRKDEALRQRFREYLQRIELYYRPERKLELDVVIEPNSIIVK